MTRQRPERLKGETAKYNMCGSLYITVNLDEKNKPFEVMAACAKLATCRSNIEALARVISKMCQLGEVEEAIDACSMIRCPHMERQKGVNKITKEQELDKIASSCPDAIARELQRYVDKKK